jgi:hypothetical protein
MLVPAWLARGVIGESEGRGFFIATVSAAVMAGMLRLHLWFMSRQHPDQLRWARQRSRHWVRMADVLFALSLLIGACLLVGRSSLDVVLLVMAIGVAIAAAVIEPATASGRAGRRPRLKTRGAGFTGPGPPEGGPHKPAYRCLNSSRSERGCSGNQ